MFQMRLSQEDGNPHSSMLCGFFHFRPESGQMNTDIDYKNNPLHGVSLKQVLTEIVDYYGFEILYAYLNINCFNTNPSIDSSVKFLKKTDWAREKVEAFYLYQFKNLPRASAEQFELPPRDRIVPQDQKPGQPAELSLEGGRGVIHSACNRYQNRSAHSLTTAIHRVFGMTDKTVEKFRLPYREYYRLHQAAEILGCSVDDLIHWAANTELTLYANLLGLLCTVHKTRCFRDEPGQPLFDDVLPDGMYMVTPDDMRYFELDGFCECVEFHWADKKGHYWHAEVDVPIKIQQKHLFVPAWEIENVKRDVPRKPFAPDGEKRRDPGTQPHHAAERFAKYREQVDAFLDNYKTRLYDDIELVFVAGMYYAGVS